MNKINFAQAVGTLAMLCLINQVSLAQTSTTNPYRVQMDWGNLPDDRPFGVVSGVFPDPDGEHLWFLDRCGGNQCAGNTIDPILKFDLEGNLVDSFGGGSVWFPARIRAGSRRLSLGHRRRFAWRSSRHAG